MKSQEHKPPKLKIVGQATAEQISIWKKENSEVHEITVEVVPGIEHGVGYLKGASRDVAARAMTMYTQSKILETGEFIINNCWLGGDERLKSDEKIAMAAAVEANQLVEFMTSSVKKL